MTIKGISHIHICVANVERSLEFYRDILGLTVKVHTQQMLNRPGAESLGMYSRLRTSRTVADIYFDGADSPQPVLVLTSHPDQVDGNAIKFDEKGITNIALQVENVESYARMLTERGVTSAGKISDFRNPTGHMRTIFVYDPDGNLVQFREGFNRDKYDDYDEPPK